MSQLQPFIQPFTLKCNSRKGEEAVGLRLAYQLVRMGCEWKAIACLNTREGVCLSGRGGSVPAGSHTLFPPQHAVGQYSSHKGSKHPL